MNDQYEITQCNALGEPLFIIRHTGEVILLGKNVKEMNDKEIAEALREIGARYAKGRAGGYGSAN